MPLAWEIVIKGKFITGTTIDDEEQAKKKCEELLLGGLERGGVSDEKGHGLFQWVKESVEAEALPERSGGEREVKKTAKGITMNKATEVFRDILRFVKPGDPPEEHDALMLGIEAFGRIKHDRQVMQAKHVLLLPGEAEE